MDFLLFPITKKIKKKRIEKKGGQKKQIHHDEKRKKMNTWGEFCRLEEF